MFDTADSHVQLHLLEGGPEDLAALQAVFDSCPTYFERVAGRPADPAEAATLFADLPPGSSLADKRVFAILSDGETVGCMDVVDDYPTAGTAMLGLLLIAEDRQGRSIGSRALGLLEEQFAAHGGVARIRIGVVRTNDAVLGFWHRMGFRETGEARPYSCGPVSSEVIVLEKPLAG